jgi:hypothetical protein
VNAIEVARNNVNLGIVMMPPQLAISAAYAEGGLIATQLILHGTLQPIGRTVAYPGFPSTLVGALTGRGSGATGSQSEVNLKFQAQATSCPRPKCKGPLYPPPGSCLGGRSTAKK